MPAYSAPPFEPVKLTGQWQATGRTRLRSAWLGILLVEIEQSAMVETGKANGRAAGTWQEVKRWRRARRGHIVTLGSDVFRAFVRGKAERH
jgi:hypothetical protein